MPPWRSAGPALEPAVEQPPKPSSSLPVHVREVSGCSTERTEDSDVSKQAGLHSWIINNSITSRICLVSALVEAAQCVSWGLWVADDRHAKDRDKDWLVHFARTPS